MKNNQKYSSVEDLPEASVASVSTVYIKTGSWRVYRPEIDKEKCIKCFICWRCCPDISIGIDEEGYPKVNYDYCKGCGICSHECPNEAIKMKREGK